MFQLGPKCQYFVSPPLFSVVLSRLYTDLRCFSTEHHEAKFLRADAGEEDVKGVSNGHDAVKERHSFLTGVARTPTVILRTWIQIRPTELKTHSFNLINLNRSFRLFWVFIVSELQDLIYRWSDLQSHLQAQRRGTDVWSLCQSQDSQSPASCSSARNICSSARNSCTCSLSWSHLRTNESTQYFGIELLISRKATQDIKGRGLMTF